jgi:hypothetical protein
MVIAEMSTSLVIVMPSCILIWASTTIGGPAVVQLRDYAHGGIKNTTISDALEFHVYGIRVLNCFNEAFDC